MTNVQVVGLFLVTQDPHRQVVRLLSAPAFKAALQKGHGTTPDGPENEGSFTVRSCLFMRK